MDFSARRREADALFCRGRPVTPLALHLRLRGPANHHASQNPSRSPGICRLLTAHYITVADSELSCSLPKLLKSGFPVCRWQVLLEGGTGMLPPHISLFGSCFPSSLAFVCFLPFPPSHTLTQFPLNLWDSHT